VSSGPDACSFFIAAAKNEQIVLSQESSRASLYRRNPTHDHTIHSRLLSAYIASVPHFIPSNDSDICAPTLWHPDLSLGNLLVSASGPGKLEGIIDWQHAAILPYFSFASMPPAIAYRGDKISMEGLVPGPLPSNLEDLSPDEEAQYRLELRLANRHKWYQGKARLNPRRRAASRLPHIYELMMLPTFVTRAWADGIFDLRQALVRIRKKWDSIADPHTPCPIKFSTEEMMEHERQLEAFRCYEGAVATIYSALNCEGDGWVAYEDYDTVRELIGSLEETWDEEITGMPFPFKDGEHSYFLSQIDFILALKN
jgi:hypothetical protein